jgi:hypothetical protein
MRRCSRSLTFLAPEQARTLINADSLAAGARGGCFFGDLQLRFEAEGGFEVRDAFGGAAVATSTMPRLLCAWAWPGCRDESGDRNSIDAGS